MNDLLVARFEWVKMFYPDMKKGMVVGIVHQAVPLEGGPPIWVFDHRTDDSQATSTSPMGIDIGTVHYLSGLVPPVTELHFHSFGSPVMYSTKLANLRGASYRTSMTGDGRLRTRVFLPTDQWVPMSVYPELKPAYWAATHLKEDGSVIVRHTPR